MLRIITCSLIFSCLLHAQIDLDQAKTRYPIVLVHGLFGFEEIVGSYRYWGELAESLRFHGATVLVARLSPAHSPIRRGEQLRELMQDWGYERYNIVAHSQGGIDSRYVLEKYPHLVASLTTIATPHHGSKVADALCVVNKIPLVSKTVWSVGNSLCHAISYLASISAEADLCEAITSLTTEGMKKFNQTYRKGISEQEDSSLFSLGFCCHQPTLADVCGWSLALVGKVFYGGERNDGVVSTKSMSFGNYCGDICGAHHIMPIKGGLAYYHLSTVEKFSTTIFNHIEHLKEQGL